MQTKIKAENFDLDEYLNRIGYTGKVSNDGETLLGIATAQTRSVPFENIDVQNGKIISLDPNDIVEKIVKNRRGGYCYELNGLFSLAMEAIGFEYDMLFARPRYGYTERRPKTHMILSVKADDTKYLTDLGFGGYGLRHPLDIGSLGGETVQDNDVYALRSDKKEYVLSVKIDGEFADLYGFDTLPAEWVDYIPANHFNSTSKNTIFTQKLIAIIQTADGRKILIGDELKTIQNGQKTVQKLDKSEITEVLSDHFGIKHSIK